MKSVLAIGVVLAACGDGRSDPDGGPPHIDARTVDAPGPVFDAFDISARPYPLYVPTGYVEGTPTPLVVLLHGYGADGPSQESYFQLQAVAEAETFLYATPSGTIDTSSSHFWNATDACCDLYDSGVDDVTYLRALIDDVAAHYTVDPKRIYFVGHSNGGFMSHRMACDVSDKIAAIVTLAGVVWDDVSRCTPSEPVSVAHVHGTADTVINYNGGSVFGQAAYPSAMTTFSTWAQLDGCFSNEPGPVMDLDSGLAGDETTIQRATGCTSGIGVELWTITGGSHIPALTQPTWPQTVWAFFAAHPKP